MIQHPTGSRTFLREAGPLGTAAQARPSTAVARASAPGEVLVRASIDDVARDLERLESLRAGVGAMRELAFRDPMHSFIWSFQSHFH